MSARLTWKSQEQGSSSPVSLISSTELQINLPAGMTTGTSDYILSVDEGFVVAEANAAVLSEAYEAELTPTGTSELIEDLRENPWTSYNVELTMENLPAEDYRGKLSSQKPF